MKFPEQIHHAMQAYLSGKATPEQGQALEAWLREDPANVRLLVDLALLDGLMLSMQKDDDAAAILLTLAEAEANAEPDFSLLHIPEFEPSLAKPAGQPMTFRKGWSLAGYAMNQALRTKAGVIGSIAALLALGVLLVVVLVGDGTPGDPQQPITDNTATKVGPVDPANPTPQSIVATLTAANDAQWQAASGSRLPDIGQGLHAGQRLTLTQGFAEITTNDGAIAILEAPASVELLNNDNALRLHSGKLMGICETESSKGFLVRTPHMDITDLGTRFGVDASRPEITEAHVFEGEVEVARPGITPTRLTSKQSARAVSGTARIEAISHSAIRFIAIRDIFVQGNKTALHNDTDGRQWLIAPSEHPGPIMFNGNEVACTVNNDAFAREIGQGNAYGFVQYRVACAGQGKPATAVGSWTLSNLPAGRYDVVTAFEPKEGIHGGGDSIRYTVNGVGVVVDQSAVPAPEAGPTFTGGIPNHYQPRSAIHFTLIGSSVVVPEGGSITVTIDNANNPKDRMAIMDSIGISLVPEDQPD